MTNQQKITLFLQAKNKIIYKNTKLRYIYDKDLEYIENLTVPVATKVWNHIKHNIMKENMAGLSEGMCPWCVLKNMEILSDCYQCTYGKNHGVCHTSSNMNEYLSGYDRIKKVVKSKGIKHHKMLNNQWYRGVISKINAL